MTVPVPFGQYIPGDSTVHHVDPRVKVLVVVAYAIVLFTAHSWTGLAVAAVAAAFVLGVSRVPLRFALRGLRPVSALLVLTLMANGIRWRPDSALVRLGPLALDGPGLSAGGFFATRIVLLVVGTSLLTLTTSPVALSDAFAQLLRPLGRLRLPVDDIAMMFSIALRFIPTTAEEAEKIIVAQSARGAVFDRGGPLQRTRAWVPVLVPLFVNLFRRADALAIAMETRCYTGVGRSRLHEPSMQRVDWCVLCGALLIVVLTLMQVR